MLDHIYFWVSKTVAEFLIALIIVTVVMLLVFLSALPTLIRQWRCKHVKYWENMRCHGICTHCRKDLGFVGTLREQRNKEEV